MENLFSQLDRQKHLEGYKIYLLSRNHPFTGDEIIKWKDKLFFDTLVFNGNVTWTLDALYEVKDLIEWEFIELKDLSIDDLSMDDFRILQLLKPYISQMKIRRKIMLSNCVFCYNISFNDVTDLFGPTVACLSGNSQLDEQVFEQYKDDPDFDWQVISKFCFLTLEMYNKYKEYWTEEELLANSSIFSDYQLVELFSEKIDWNALNKPVFNDEFYKFALTYPEYEHLNWIAISIHKNALKYIISEPDFPYWNWKYIYQTLDINTFNQLKTTIFKRDMNFKLYYNNNHVLLTPQYIGRSIVRNSGVFETNKFPQLDEVQEWVLQIQSIFVKIGTQFKIPLELFEKYYINDEILKIEDEEFNKFWELQSDHLTVEFLRKNNGLLDRILTSKKLKFRRLPYTTIKKYPQIVNTFIVRRVSGVTWEDIVESILNKDSILRYNNEFNNGDPDICELLLKEYNYDLDRIMSEQID
jgi:hypothetical protein